MTIPALEIRGLDKTFPGTRALRSIDFEVNPGEVHALVGHNGSGKSTFVKLLSGFHQPDHPVHAAVNGTEFRLGDPDSAHAVGLRFVHQDLALINTLDAVDNLALGFGYAQRPTGGIAWTRQRAAARRALGALGVTINLSVPVGRLSAFEKTAVAIARALQGGDEDIAVLVLDEPTATMPKPHVDRLFTVIRRVAENGAAVVLVTHHIDEVFAASDRVTVFGDGTRVGTYQTSAIGRAELVETLIGTQLAETQTKPVESWDEVVMQVSGLSGRNLMDLDIEVHSGEIVGIAGLDGSGRDEVCELIFGATPRTGEVRVDGKALPPSRPDLSITAGVALVPADRHAMGLVMSHSVRENLTLVDLAPFWNRLLLRSRREIADTKDWIRKLKIRTSSSESLVSTLSGGNQQKVVMAKWLRTGPKVLLLNEPTQGVDIGTQSEIHSLVRSTADDGSGVLVCSTDERELSQLCHRVLVLCNGRVTAVITGDELTPRAITVQTLATATTAGATRE